MRLYLMRHAEAAPHGTYARDEDRPLTDEGRSQAREVAKGLQRLKILPDVIVSSPYVRAVQTADEVQRVLGEQIKRQELGALRSESYSRDTSLALKLFSPYEHVLLVGHEPHLSAWISELVAGEGGMHCVMKKAGVACIDIDQVPPRSGSGTLRWLMKPKHLALIGTSKD